MATHTLTVPNWHPARVNELLGHWRKAHRLKSADRNTVVLEAYRQGVPKARGKRRVHLEIVLGPGQRGADPDAFWKSSLDALVRAGLLVDDRKECVELAPVTFSRGERKATVITLTDLEGEA
jgi:hypothetical protein